MMTPWGKADHKHVVAPGITVYATPSHGGIHLSAKRHATLQEKFRFETFAGGRWYEEDCDVVAVMLAFPECYPPERLEQALAAARGMAKRDGDDGWDAAIAYCEARNEAQGLIDAMKDSGRLVIVHIGDE